MNYKLSLKVRKLSNINERNVNKKLINETIELRRMPPEYVATLAYH